MRLYAKVLWSVCFVCVTSLSLRAEENIAGAVVKIYAVYNSHNYYEPWQMAGQRRRYGSGCIIAGNRILTSAHLVADCTFLQVKRAREAKKYMAEVEVVAHDCDLAILQVKDDSFFSDIKPLALGDLAEIRDRINVYGFPVGGDEMSITEGVVSRIEHINYTHSNAYLLACQIDASINPGNSGGPVLKNGKIIGVAFQAFQAGQGENIGYMVAVPVIRQFIDDIKDAYCDGIPDLGFRWQRMENPDLRLKYGMAEKQTGVLVNEIYLGSPGEGIIKPGDIILSVNGHNIENDGTVDFRKGERTSFRYYVQKKQINDTLPLEILREDEVIRIQTKLSMNINTWRLIPHKQYNKAPTYYIIGGLVFESLTQNFLMEWGRSWKSRAPRNLVNYYYNGKRSEGRKEIVVLVKVLADEINAGYHELVNKVISYANNRRISTIRDLTHAIENHEGRYHTLVDERGMRIVVEKKKVDENNQKILDKYKIISDRSEDLQHKF